MAVDLIQARLAMSVKDIKLAENYANELGNLGFKILKVSPRGISFAGDRHLFEKVFESKIEESTGGMKFVTEPKVPDKIKNHVDSIYFPTRPIFFE